MSELSVIGGVAVLPLLVALVEVVKRAGVPARWLPLVALLLGVALGVALAATRPVVTSEGLLLGALWGATLGLGAVGLYSGATNVAGVR